MTAYCSFCGKSQHEVSHLIANEPAFICSECVWLCTKIIEEYPLDVDPLIAGMSRAGREAKL